MEMDTIKKSIRKWKVFFENWIAEANTIGRNNKGSFILKSLRAYSKSVVHKSPNTWIRNKVVTNRATLLLRYLFDFSIKLNSRIQFPSKMNWPRLIKKFDHGNPAIRTIQPKMYNKSWFQYFHLNKPLSTNV